MAGGVLQEVQKLKRPYNRTLLSNPFISVNYLLTGTYTPKDDIESVFLMLIYLNNEEDLQWHMPEELERVDKSHVMQWARMKDSNSLPSEIIPPQLLIGLQSIQNSNDNSVDYD